MFYGRVTRIPKDDTEYLWTTVAYDNPKDPDPEGNFLYEFTQQNNWTLVIHTKKDAQFFMDKPDDYIVELYNTRPERPERPRRQPVEVPKAPVAEAPSVDDVIEVARKATPKKAKE